MLWRSFFLIFLNERGLITNLSEIKNPEDIKNFSKKELATLAQEIREKIISTVGKNGGHLASNLGVVELTIALFRSFNQKNDAIIWDVSHQCYAHKLLTGRFEKFDGLRNHGGISGFTKMAESPYDYFDNGHASTSISSGLGLLTARTLLDNQKEGNNCESGKVVAVIGDGALTGGLAFEGLCHAGQLQKNLIIVLNDNQMSIGRNNGTFSRYLSRITMSSQYQSIRNGIDNFANKIPLINKFLPKFIYKFKRGLKGLFLANNMFVEFGYEYVGPLNGHDIHEMELVLNRVKKLNKPVVVHVITRKGKGYKPAEKDPQKFHGIGPFSIEDGSVKGPVELTYTDVFSNEMVALGEKNKKIVCITAAMAKGTGLDAFSRHYPERFFDVGIAEEHAVTFAGGLAKGGLIPVVAIYSTFIQRSIDQIIHDVALPNFHVIFMLDRSGAVPNDGETHQGIFDIALMRSIPNLTILSPASAFELKTMLDAAIDMKGPVVIRYPKLVCSEELDCFRAALDLGKGILIKASDLKSDSKSKSTSKKSSTLLITTGSMINETTSAAISLKAKGISADIYNLRYIKPIDEEYLVSICKGYKKIVIVEDGVKQGGIGEYIEGVLLKAKLKDIKVLGFPQSFISQGTRAEVLKDAHLSAQDIKNAGI